MDGFYFLLIIISLRVYSCACAREPLAGNQISWHSYFFAVASNVTLIYSSNVTFFDLFTLLRRWIRREHQNPWRKRWTKKMIKKKAVENKTGSFKVFKQLTEAPNPLFRKNTWKMHFSTWSHKWTQNNGKWEQKKSLHLLKRARKCTL